MTVQELLQAAREADITIATAESCTGGMVCSALTDIPGSSDVVECGFVTYSNNAKICMLNIDPKTLEDHGAVSPQIAVEMVVGALQNSTADLAVSITGIAGPGGSEHKPEGRVCFAVQRRGDTPHSETVEFGAQGRPVVRRLARDHALKLLSAALS